MRDLKPLNGTRIKHSQQKKDSYKGHLKSDKERLSFTKRLGLLVCTLLDAFRHAIAQAQGHDFNSALPINPQNHPYFYVMGILTTKKDASSAIVISGCFGNLKPKDDADEKGIDVLGFDEDNPIELKLADACVFLTPMYFSENIVINLPCRDVMKWFTAQNEGKDKAFTFYAVLTLDAKNQVTQMVYHYPHGVDGKGMGLRNHALTI